MWDISSLKVSYEEDIAKTRRVMQLFDIYSVGTSEQFRNLLVLRRAALEQLFDDLETSSRLASEREQQLTDGYRNLLLARSALRGYLQRTFPLVPLPPPRPYNIHVSGGTVGVIGDWGSTTTYAGGSADEDYAANVEHGLAQAEKYGESLRRGQRWEPERRIPGASNLFRKIC